MLRQFYEYYRPWKRLFWLDFGCAVLSGLLELAFPLAVAAFIDDLLPSGDMSLTVLAAIGLLLIYFVNAGLMTIVIYWGHKLGINIETEMRRRAFEHLQKLSFSYFDRVRTGKLVARVTRDLEEIGESDKVFARGETASALPSRHCRLVAAQTLRNVVLGQAAACAEFTQTRGEMRRQRAGTFRRSLVG